MPRQRQFLKTRGECVAGADRSMSALGHKRTSKAVRAMSALPPKLRSAMASATCGQARFSTIVMSAFCQKDISVRSRKPSKEDSTAGRWRTRAVPGKTSRGLSLPIKSLVTVAHRAHNASTIRVRLTLTLFVEGWEARHAGVLPDKYSDCRRTGCS
jgi:hypothetical protein